MVLLLRPTAIIEVATGLGLVAVPVLVVWLLLGAEITGASIPLARVAGVALLALGLACWLVQSDAASSARGLVSAMVLYNLGATTVLAVAGFVSHMIGIALWPAVIIHAAMALWCIASLRSQSSRLTREGRIT